MEKEKLSRILTALSELCHHQPLGSHHFLYLLNTMYDVIMFHFCFVKLFVKFVTLFAKCFHLSYYQLYCRLVRTYLVCKFCEKSRFYGFSLWQNKPETL